MIVESDKSSVDVYKHANVMLLILMMGEGCHVICLRQVKSIIHLGTRCSIYMNLMLLTGSKVVITDLEGW